MIFYYARGSSHSWSSGCQWVDGKTFGKLIADAYLSHFFSTFGNQLEILALTMWPLQRTNIYCINISDIHISCFLFRYFLLVKKKLTFCLKLYTGSQYLYCKSPRISMRLLNERLWGIQNMIYPPLLCYRKDLCIYFVNIKGFSNSFMGNQHIPTDCQTSHPTTRHYTKPQLSGL